MKKGINYWVAENLNFSCVIIYRHELRIKRRHIRDFEDPFSMPEKNFRGIYRLSRETARDLVDEISAYLVPQKEEIAIPTVHKVLASLHFLAQGSYQNCVSQQMFVPMAQQTLSKCLHQVTTTIVNSLGHFIKFPTTEEERNKVKRGFVEKGGFPGILGAIDCTHVAIQAPPFNNPEMPGILFLNRKGFYSINTQIVVDSNLKILAVNARFPGSVHDSAIWATSQVKRTMEQIYQNGDRSSWLIGDSGYPLQPFLMTPINGINLNESERNFNQVHKSSRNVIERLNGILKARFRCCLGHRTLHYKPEVAANIINTCCILHNICLTRGEMDEPDDEQDIYINLNLDDEPNLIADGVDADHNNIQINWLNEGRITRQRILNTFF